MVSKSGWRSFDVVVVLENGRVEDKIKSGDEDEADNEVLPLLDHAGHALVPVAKLQRCAPVAACE